MFIHIIQKFYKKKLESDAKIILTECCLRVICLLFVWCLSSKMWFLPGVFCLFQSQHLTTVHQTATEPLLWQFFLALLQLRTWQVHDFSYLHKIVLIVFCYSFCLSFIIQFQMRFIAIHLSCENDVSGFILFSLCSFVSAGYTGWDDGLFDFIQWYCHTSKVC